MKKNYSELEDRIKQMAKEQYGSVLAFCNAIDMPYATFASMMLNGVNKSTVDNVLKVCKGLGISGDALSRGQIEQYYRYKAYYEKLSKSQETINIEYFDLKNHIKWLIQKIKTDKSITSSYDEHVIFMLYKMLFLILDLLDDTNSESANDTNETR